MLNKNKLKDKLQSGKPVIGIWNTLASPIVTEIIAQAGFDFQIIDLEHGPFIINDIHSHISACEVSSQCTPLVRIPENQEWMVLQALDQGSYGIVAPHIDSKESAEKLIQHTRYSPEGNRGFTPFSKAGGFTNTHNKDYVLRANTEILNVVIIESKEGLDELQNILEVDEVDIVYFGAYDLSQSLGCHGDVKNNKVVSAIKQGVNLVNQYGKYAGGFVPQTQEDIKWLLDMGMKFITYQVDSSIIYSNVSAINNWFSKETGQ